MNIALRYEYLDIDMVRVGAEGAGADLHVVVTRPATPSRRW